MNDEGGICTVKSSMLIYYYYSKLFSITYISG